MVPPASILALSDAAVAAPLRLPEPAPAPAAPRRDVSFQLSALHDRHAAELLRFCRWMLRDPDDAADALQDTWIRAMAALSEDRVAVTAMRPWLYAIARNACLDRLRERKRASNHELDESALGEGPAADEVAGLRNEARAALALIGTLSERQRSALLMREIAGMSVPEIADALGVTVERAQWTIADARKALEDSDGRALRCDVARDRLDRGARGRALRAHLSTCDDCRAHDRAMRVKRVLAPALVPLLWLRRGAHLLAPLAQPAAVAVVASTLVMPHAGAVRHHAHAPAPVAPRRAPVHSVALAPTRAPRHLVSPRASESRRRPAPHPLTRASRPGVDDFHPAGGGSMSSAPRVPAEAPAHSLPIVAHPVQTVRTVVTKAVQVVDATVPAAAPVVDRAASAVRQLAPGL